MKPWHYNYSCMLHYNALKLCTCRVNTIFLLPRIANILAKHHAVFLGKQYRIACLTANFVISNINYLCIFFSFTIEKIPDIFVCWQELKYDQKQRWNGICLVKQEIVNCCLFCFVRKMILIFHKSCIFPYFGEWLENSWILTKSTRLNSANSFSNFTYLVKLI